MKYIYLLVILSFFIVFKLGANDSIKNTIIIDKKTKEDLESFYLKINSSKITKVQSYTPGFDYQGFNFYVGDKLLLNIKVIVDYPNFPSQKIPKDAISFSTKSGIGECHEWDIDKTYSGECLVKYAYIKKYDIALYAQIKFEQLSVKHKKIAMDIINSIEINYDL